MSGSLIEVQKGQADWMSAVRVEEALGKLAHLLGQQRRHRTDGNDHNMCSIRLCGKRANGGLFVTEIAASFRSAYGPGCEIIGSSRCMKKFANKNIN